MNANDDVIQQASQPLLSVTGLTKSFGANRALDDVSFTVGAGEIVGLLGHNGSGKSTIIKILAGVYTSDGGDVALGTDEVELHFIHQDLGLIPQLSVVENLWVNGAKGQSPLAPNRGGRDTARAKAMLDRFDMELDLTAPLALASPAQRTIVAIARALDGWHHDKNVLILDEPTEALHASEVEMLFDAVRKLAAAGTGVVFVSHRLNEVLALTDRAIVLKDGRKIADERTADLDDDSLLELVTGAQPVLSERDIAGGGEPGDEAVRISGLTGAGLTSFDLSVMEGEIVGIAGVLGSGREHVASLLFGGTPGTADEFTILGQPYPRRSPAESIRRGMGFVPGDRRAHGAVRDFSAKENMTLPNMTSLITRIGTLSTSRERRTVDDLMRDYAVHPASSALPFSSFSGGNQQKIVLAKWLRNEPAVLVLEEPTQGVDSGAKRVIYASIDDAAARGAAVIVCSSDAKELALIADRVLVMREGQVAAELTGDALTEAAIIGAGYGIDSRRRGATALAARIGVERS